MKLCLYPYRYGFNGKENDNSIASTGDGAQDYGVRIYNPALGKFLSVDPLFKKYAYKSPYDFAENSPILGKDLDGAELQIDIEGNQHYGPIDIAKVNQELLQKQQDLAQKKGMNNPNTPNNENTTGKAFRTILDRAGTTTTTAEMGAKVFFKGHQVTENGNFRPRTSTTKKAGDIAKATKGIKAVGTAIEVTTIGLDVYKIITADDKKGMAQAVDNLKNDGIMIGVGRANPATGILLGLYDYFKDNPEFIRNQYEHFKQRSEKTGSPEDLHILSKYAEV